jgi:uncharacterized protein YqhQ
VGGQAVIEGVMMRGVGNWSLAVRRPDHSVVLHSWPLVSWMKRYPALKAPIVRGVVALVESMVIGIRALTISANEALMVEGEAPQAGEGQVGGPEGGASSGSTAPKQALGKTEMAVTVFISLAIAVGLFFLAPLGLTRIFKPQLGTGIVFWLVEGLIRVAIFVLYLAVMTRIPDLRRVFEYHGAEHMAIHALEHGEPLTPSACRKYRTLHVRCGTSFLLVVMVVSILVFALVRYPAWYWLVLSRVVLIPLIAGISYEIIKAAGRFETNPVVRVVMAPGLALQWLTTRQPDDSQLEVAISALRRIIELEPQDRPPERGVEVMA